MDLRTPQDWANFAQNLIGQTQNFGQVANGAAASARKAEAAIAQITRQHEAFKNANAQLVQQMAHMQGMVEAFKAAGARGAPEASADVVFVESQPGRRVAYDVTCTIPIPTNMTGPITWPYTISTDGPFVATSRYAIFVSAYTFQVTNGDARTRYNGRSFGRQRPVSSHLDLLDAQQGWTDFWPFESTQTMGCDEGDSPPYAQLPSRPNSRNPFRTMEGDFYIQLSNTTYPRQNAKVPSGLWAQGFEGVTPLPVQDYFAKAETIEFIVEPMHPNNPEFGNVQSILGSMPFIGAQFDGHEGVGYPNNWVCADDQADTIIRNPAGYLIVGLFGYRIIEPAGTRL